ncbi:MAG: zinc ribbon domain-containing protein [Pirellulales bacterium]|nr:zinc ribbon domain-containing protein [Pirellulales bacterium]
MSLVPAEKKISDDTLPLPHGEPCRVCGSPIEAGDHYCAGCGDVIDDSSRQESPDVEPERRFFRCKNCGSEVATNPDQRSYVCAFCDSTYVVEFSRDQSERQRPEFVVGFTVTKEQADERFREWIGRNRWFRPVDVAASTIVERLQGVYMPFWLFSTLAKSGWSARIGEHWYRTETYTEMVNGKPVTRSRQVRETEWWDLAGRHHKYHTRFVIVGSSRLTPVDAERIKPFRLEALKRYEPYFLAGWLAEEYSIDRDEAFQQCKAAFDRQERAAIGQFMPGDEHRELQAETEFKHIQSDLILLPVYVLSYRYREKVYRFLMNGQTGKLAGDKPVSRGRIGAAIGIGVLALMILFLIVRLLSG